MEVVFSGMSVCLFVCMFARLFVKDYELVFMNISGGVLELGTAQEGADDWTIQNPQNNLERPSI